MRPHTPAPRLNAVEICAGAGGQALGLLRAGFTHELAIELDPAAADTLRHNLRLHTGTGEHVITGDAADPQVWTTAQQRGLALPGRVDLLAGGVPCPPFSLAGKQLGATDERDLFAWAVEHTAQLRPRALLLENVRGLSTPRFSGYRQHILDRLTDLGYVAEWRLLHASDFGVPQLRPRFVLVALQEQFSAYFRWPATTTQAPTVGHALRDLMGARGWEGADDWAAKANGIAPTIVGGSKKHGGADLGPTRARQAWAQLGVDGRGVANHAPEPGQDFTGAPGPKLTTAMLEILQGWQPGEWQILGRKTAQYRQIGNAFPPPVAHALGAAIRAALLRQGEPADRDVHDTHDPIYRALRDADGYLSAAQIAKATGTPIAAHDLEHRISMLSKDFEVTIGTSPSGIALFKLGRIKAFLGQADHIRHELFNRNLAQIS